MSSLDRTAIFPKICFLSFDTFFVIVRRMHVHAVFVSTNFFTSQRSYIVRVVLDRFNSVYVRARLFILSPFVREQMPIGPCKRFNFIQLRGRRERI